MELSAQLYQMAEAQAYSGIRALFCYPNWS